MPYPGLAIAVIVVGTLVALLLLGLGKMASADARHVAPPAGELYTEDEAA